MFTSSSDADSLELVPLAGPQLSGSGSSSSSGDELPVTSADSPPPSPVTTQTGGEFIQASPDPERSSSPALTVIQPPPPIATLPHRADPVSPDDQLVAYQISWAASRLSRRKSKIRMCLYEQVRFFAQRLTSRPGAPLWVVYAGGARCSASQWAARVFNKGRRFWLQVPGPGGDLIGFHFCDPNGQKSGPRGLHVAIARTAATQELELSRVAETGFGDPDRVRVFASRPPARMGDEKAVFAIASVKNFIVQDENGQTVFMIYKSSDSTCTLKTRDPISPLMAFGLAVAIITTGE
jgi:hypothetical protein